MKNLIVLTFFLLLFSGCKFEEETAESGGGSLFAGHKEVTDAFSMTAPASGKYSAGDELVFKLSHPYVLTVAGGVPDFTIDIGGSQVLAEYVSGSGSKNLFFKYTILAGENDSDGISLVSASINLNGATIEFYNGTSVQAANLALSAPPLAAVLVDTAAPRILSLSPPPSARYLVNKTMSFFATFDEKVYVTGAPQMEITLDSGAVYAQYVSGSGSDTLKFQYNVTAADSDAAGGIDMVSPLLLNGGTIKDAVGNADALSLDFPAGNIAVPGITVDGDLPYVTSFIPPADATYVPGDVIQFSLKFSENVNVTENPRVAIDIGGTDRYANYSSGSGSDTLIFKYSVTPGNEDTDGVNVGDLIDVSVGASDIADIGGTSIDPTMTIDTPRTPGALVDAPLPKVTSISLPSLPADGYFHQGEEIYFTLNFNVDVTVTGFPQLGMDLNSYSPTVTYIDYSSGSGTSSLVMRYVVQAGDEDLDGLSLVSPLNLNSGTIQDTNGTNADLDISTVLASLDTSTLLVDGRGPTVDSITAPPDKTYGIGENIDFILNFSEVVNVTNFPRVALDIGGVPAYATYVTGTGSANLTFRYTVQAGDEDVDGIQVTSTSIDLNTTGTIIDDAGNAAVLDISTVIPTLTSVFVDGIIPVVTNVAITANTYTGGQTITVNVTYDVTVFVATAAPIISATFTQTAGTPQFTYQTGSGSTILQFTYVVAAGDEDLDGIDLAASINLNGATIKDANGNGADLALTTTNFANVFVDALAPVVTLTTPADATYINSATDSTTFTVDGTCNDSTASYDIKVDGVSAAGQVGMSCNGTNFTGTIDTTGITEGLRSFTVVATDPAGNSATSAANGVTRDITPPSVTLTTPADASFINTDNDSTTFAIDGSCDDAAATYIIEVGGASAPGQAGISCDGVNLSGTIDTTALAEGVHSFTVEATDLASNPSTSAANSVTKDTVASTATLTTPADASYINIASNSATFSIGGTCNDAASTIDIQVDGASVAGQAGVGCNGTNLTGTIDTTGLAQGARSFTVVVTDTSSNTTTSAANSVTKDTIAPSAALSTPANGGYINSASDSTTFGIGGTCDDAAATIDIQVDGTSVAGQTGVGCDGANLTGTIDTTGLAQGTRSFTVVATDVAGNAATSAANSVTKDTIAPVAVLTTPADGSYINSANSSGSFSVLGTCDDAGATYNLYIDNANTKTLSCDGSTLSGAFNSNPLAQGLRLFKVVSTDTYSNSSTSAVNNVTKDTNAPTISSISPPASGNYGFGATMDFTVNFNESVNVSGTRLGMTVGSATLYAGYSSGTGSANPVYSYTVGGSDYDTDGIALISPLELNGGTLTDLAGNPATLTFAAPDTSLITVNDGTPAFQWQATSGGVAITTYDFGGQTGYSEKQLYIKNIGTAPSSTSIAASITGGTSFSVSLDNCQGGSLAINAECTVTIGYTPDSLNSLNIQESGEATIQDSGFAGPPSAAITLTGTPQ